MRVPLVPLLLSCAAALSRAAVILDNGAPIMWAHATATLNELPITDGVLTPDPWHYLQRMSFHRLLIAATDQFMGCMGPGENESPMWGLPLQLGWMLTSGRLADPSGTTTCGVQTGETPDMCISPNSWWGCVNYFSSVLPFLSAAKNGFFGEGVSVLMVTTSGAQGYCTTYETCKAAHPDAMTKWDDFFTGLKQSSSSTLPDNEKKDALLGLYWNALVASTHASSVCQDKLGYYSSVEKSFAQSWLNAGEYVAAAYFQASLGLAPQFMSPLPGRVLKEEDSAPNIPDLPPEENHTVYIFSWMSSADSLLGGTLVNMWHKAMCSVETRENGRLLLKSLMTDTEYATSSFITIITSMSGSCL